MTKYYLLIEGEKKGPYALSQLRKMWDSGAITMDTRYTSEGMGGWADIGELMEPPLMPKIKSELGGASASPSSPQLTPELNPHTSAAAKRVSNSPDTSKAWGSSTFEMSLAGIAMAFGVIILIIALSNTQKEEDTFDPVVTPSSEKKIIKAQPISDKVAKGIAEDVYLDVRPWFKSWYRAQRSGDEYDKKSSKRDLDEQLSQSLSERMNYRNFTSEDVRKVYGMVFLQSMSDM